MPKFEEINKDLQSINEKLFIRSSVEDYCEEEREEYGIEYIEETRHLSLNYWNVVNSHSTIIKEYFDFKEPRSLNFSDYHKGTLRHLGFNEKEILNIIAVFWKHSK